MERRKSHKHTERRRMGKLHQKEDNKHNNKKYSHNSNNISEMNVKDKHEDCVNCAKNRLKQQKLENGAGDLEKHRDNKINRDHTDNFKSRTRLDRTHTQDKQTIREKGNIATNKTNHKHSLTKEKEKQTVKDANPKTVRNADNQSDDFNHVSLILLNNVDRILTHDTGYEVMFNSGILEGTGLSVNKRGSHIKFNHDGSYVFELLGDVIEDVPEGEIKLVFCCDNFQDETKQFSETILHRKFDSFLSLNNSKTILPINKGQIVSVKIIPSNHEPIALLKGSKFLVYRIA